MKILLTGGSGMVGKNFLEHPSVRAFDVVHPSRRELDLLDFEKTARFVRKCKPDLVIHAAGRVGGIQANIREPLSFFTENLDMGRNLVHACHRAWVKRLINLGSSCMYPRNAKNPLTEEMILTGELEPTNEGYALAKIAVARLCEYVSRQDNAFEYKTLLPCNLFGRHDKFDPGQSHFIAAALHKVHLAKANEEKSVEVWGDGSARREFMYAGDLAHCLVEAVNRFESLPETMNVGTGEDLTIDEYYRLVASVVGYQGEFKHDVSKPVGMQRKLLDVSRAKSWGWKSQTPLRKALEQTYDFYLHGTGNASGQELSVGKSDLG